jgi:6-phosphogluconate dehydrogenase
VSQPAQRAFAVVGLGKIGGGLAAQALEKGYRVVGVDPRPPDRALLDAGLVAASRVADLREALARPRVTFLYVPAGAAVDALLDELCPVLEPGDVIVDGGNSYWGDSQRRYARVRAHDLHFVDMGTSGGPSGARHGACFMVGGTADAYALVEPILRDLAVDGAVVHCGAPGAGHFTKLVHNGIEFGMLQAIGEGLELLERSPMKLPVQDILRVWTRGSVIRSWLVELLADQYAARGGLADVPRFVEDTGEVNWLVEDAMRLEVPIPVIAQAVMQLIASRDGDRSAAAAVAAIRHGFGGHPFGEDRHIAEVRRTSRVGPPPDPGDGKPGGKR